MKRRGRYDASDLPDAQFEPGSRRRVLRNLLGIRSAREMARAESEALVEAQKRLVSDFTDDHRFAARDICRIHKAWLGGIHAWAGEYRSVNLAKGDFAFAASAQIPRLMSTLEKGPLAAYTPCVFKEQEQIVRALAVVHAELVLIHPFREGNGRCARLVALLMASQAGLPPLDFASMSGRGKQRYIAAIHAAMGEDYEPMIDCFRKVVRGTLRKYRVMARP